jgi:predicted  nucleic acid-binding Zn-ribbon protein
LIEIFTLILQCYVFDFMCGGYGIVVHVDEKQKAKIIDDVKVAVCPECGNIEMYLEDLTNLKD